MPEEEAFAVLVSIMQDSTMREMYKPDMYFLGLCIYQFEAMIQVDDHVHEPIAFIRKSLISLGIAAQSSSSFPTGKLQHFSVRVELVFNLVHQSISLYCCLSHDGFVFK
jgi:hypothetical protein